MQFQRFVYCFVLKWEVTLIILIVILKKWSVLLEIVHKDLLSEVVPLLITIIVNRHVTIFRLLVNWFEISDVFHGRNKSHFFVLGLYLNNVQLIFFFIAIFTINNLPSFLPWLIIRCFCKILVIFFTILNILFIINMSFHSIEVCISNNSSRSISRDHILQSPSMLTALLFANS